MVILLGLAIASIISLILLIYQPPVLIRVPNPDSVRGRPLLLVLNPFRNKEPENAAELFFEKLKDGKCLEATAHFAPEKSDRICRKQIEYPLERWDLIDIERKTNTFELTYNHQSQNHPWGEDMTIWLEKRGQDYQVTAFVIGY
jgi:hypothetical protein